MAKNITNNIQRYPLDYEVGRARVPKGMRGCIGNFLCLHDPDEGAPNILVVELYAFVIQEDIFLVTCNDLLGLKNGNGIFIERNHFFSFSLISLHHRDPQHLKVLDVVGPLRVPEFSDPHSGQKQESEDVQVGRASLFENRLELGDREESGRGLCALWILNLVHGNGPAEVFSNGPLKKIGQDLPVFADRGSTHVLTHKKVEKIAHAVAGKILVSGIPLCAAPSFEPVRNGLVSDYCFAALRSAGRASRDFMFAVIIEVLEEIHRDRPDVYVVAPVEFFGVVLLSDQFGFGGGRVRTTAFIFPRAGMIFVFYIPDSISLESSCHFAPSLHQVGPKTDCKLGVNVLKGDKENSSCFIAESSKKEQIRELGGSFPLTSNLHLFSLLEANSCTKKALRIEKILWCFFFLYLMGAAPEMVWGLFLFNPKTWRK